MIAQQQAYRPAVLAQAHPRPVLAQVLPTAALSVPPPPPDFLFTGFTGLPGFVEALLVLAATGAAGWVGISTGLSKDRPDYTRAAGWVGGIGASLLGVLYLGAKTGWGTDIGLPAVRVSPT